MAIDATTVRITIGEGPTALHYRYTHADVPPFFSRTQVRQWVKGFAARTHEVQFTPPRTYLCPYVRSMAVHAWLHGYNFAKAQEQ